MKDIWNLFNANSTLNAQIVKFFIQKSSTRLGSSHDEPLSGCKRWLGLWATATLWGTEGGIQGKMDLFPLPSSGETLLGSKHLHKTSWLQWTGARKCRIFFWAALVLARFHFSFATKAWLYASAWLVWTISFSSAHQLSFTSYAIVLNNFQTHVGLSTISKNPD